MGTIFLSYAREDKGRAEAFAYECEARGGDPWWDRDLLSGDRYIEAILRQIAQADYFVLLLSPVSAKSGWVAFEAGAARARESAIERDFIRIAQLADCPVPDFLGDRNASAWSTDEEMKALMRSLDLPAEVDYKPPAGAPDRSLTIFRSGGQWMELIASRRGLECVLVDTGEQRARVQWRMERDEVKDCLTQGYIAIQPVRPDRGWATFSLQHNVGWRWSPILFTSRDGASPEQNFDRELHEILESVAGF